MGSEAETNGLKIAPEVYSIIRRSFEANKKSYCNSILIERDACGSSNVSFEYTLGGGTRKPIESFLTSNPHRAIVSRLKILGDMNIAERSKEQHGKLYYSYNGEYYELDLVSKPADETVKSEGLEIKLHHLLFYQFPDLD